MPPRSQITCLTTREAVDRAIAVIRQQCVCGRSWPHWDGQPAERTALLRTIAVHALTVRMSVPVILIHRFDGRLFADTRPI